MSRRFGVKAAVLAMLAIPLILGAANCYAGQPEPPGGAKVTGKAIDARLTALRIEVSGYPLVVTVIVGTCEKMPIAIGPGVNIAITPENIAEVTAADLEDVLLEDAAPPGCYPEWVTDVVIASVKSFINTGTAISAEITLQAVEY